MRFEQIADTFQRCFDMTRGLHPYDVRGEVAFRYIVLAYWRVRNAGRVDLAEKFRDLAKWRLRSLYEKRSDEFDHQPQTKAYVPYNGTHVPIQVVDVDSTKYDMRRRRALRERYIFP